MNSAEWIRSFTSMPVTPTDAPVPESKDEEGKPLPGLLDTVETFEKDARLKALLLSEVRKKLAQVKSRFQKAMQQEVKLKETYLLGLFHKKAKLLNVEGTQLDEADAEELLLTEATEFEPGTQEEINKGGMVIAQCHETLKEAKNSKGEKLFTKQELESEFWTPLMRERILPETYIADAYSLTRKMIDETNAAYISEAEKRTAAGTATVIKGRGESAANETKRALDLLGDIAGQFGEPGKMAAMGLKGLAGAIDAGQSIAEQVSKGEWGDVASSGILVLKGLTSALMKGFGVSDNITKAVEGGLDAASAVSKAAAKFASGPDGVIEGVACLVDALGKSLTAGASSKEADTGLKKTLEDLSTFLPGAIMATVRGGQMIKCVRENDGEGAMTALNAAISEGFKLARAAQLKSETENMPEEKAKTYTKEFEEATLAMSTDLEKMVSSSPELVARMCEKSRMTEHRAAVQDVIDKICDQFESAVKLSGLPPDFGTDLSSFYAVNVKPQAVLDILFATDFDPGKAGEPLVAALGATLGELPANSEVKTAATSWKITLELVLSELSKPLSDLLGTAKETKSYETVIATFTNGLDSGCGRLDTAMLGEALKAASTDPGFAKDAQQKVAAKKVAIVKDEVQKELDALDTVVDGMTEAQRAGADASAIDDLIAQLMVDRLILKMATDVVAGGTAMLAKVVPGLAAVSSGVRMVAQLVKAAQRAQQLNRWLDSRDDFEAAQSSLSSASRNFIKNQREQLADHSVEAALELARLIGAAAEMSGVATAVGVALKGATDAVENIKKQVKEHYDEKQLTNAWKLFEKSMANPSNRRLALQVRGKHPTLAKYTIAWGAVNGDLLARNAVRACGLNEAALKNRDTNIEKVVKYLEVFYEEDQQIYAVIPDTMSWVPVPFELNVKYWARVKLAAQSKALWDKPVTGVLDGLLIKLESQIQASEVAEKKVEDAAANNEPSLLSDLESYESGLNARVDVLMQLKQSFSSTDVQGVKADPKSLAEFKSKVLGGLAAKAERDRLHLATVSANTRKRIEALKKSTQKEPVTSP